MKQHRIIARHTLRYLAVDRERLKVRIAEFDTRVSLGSDGALDCRALTRNVLIGYIDRKVCAAAVITDIIRTIFLYIRIDIINSYPDVCELDYHCAASLSVDILPRQARSVNLFYAAQKADFTTSRLFICFAARDCGICRNRTSALLRSALGYALPSANNENGAYCDNSGSR